MVLPRILGLVVISALGLVVGCAGSTDSPDDSAEGSDGKDSDSKASLPPKGPASTPDPEPTPAPAPETPAAASAAGSALEFDGADDFVRVKRQIQDDFTIEAWIKTTVSATSASQRWFDGVPLVYADVSGSANDFGMAILNSKLVFGATDKYVATSTTSVDTGAWVHVAVARQKTAGKITLLVNGAVEADVTGPTSALTASQFIDFGRDPITSSTQPTQRFFQGTMDEVRIWSVARTATDIASTMKAQLTGTEANLVGYWRFDEAAGSVAKDSSPSGNDGVYGDREGVPSQVTSDAF